VGYVAYMEEIRNAYEVSIRKLEWREITLYT
jgi:hypothetical protein